MSCNDDIILWWSGVWSKMLYWESGMWIDTFEMINLHMVFIWSECT